MLLLRLARYSRVVTAVASANIANCRFKDNCDCDDAGVEPVKWASVNTIGASRMNTVDDSRRGAALNADQATKLSGTAQITTSWTNKWGLNKSATATANAYAIRPSSSL